MRLESRMAARFSR